MIFSVLFCVVMISFGHGSGKEIFSGAAAWPSAEEMQADQKDGGMLEALMGSEDACYGRRCVAAADCCKGSVCVDVDGGTCLPVYGKKDGEPCELDSDCESGLACGDPKNAQKSKACQVVGRGIQKKALNDECETSAECETSRGLCCQVLRRHRMASKKVCHYFVDPLSCIGKLETKMKPIHFIPNSFFKARMG